LNVIVDFEQHMSEMGHTFNVLEFYVKMWCQSQSYNFY